MAASEAVRLVQERAAIPPIDPIMAYLKLRSAGLRPLLLQGASAHPEARWSFIGFDPVVELRLAGDGYEAHWTDGAVEAGAAPPLETLREWTDQFRCEANEEAPFTGGWIGYLGFGLAAAIESTLAQVVGPSAGEMPDAILRLARGALAFDQQSGTVAAYMADLDGDRDAARVRLDDCLRLLLAPPPPGPPERFEVETPWVPSLGEADFQAAARRLRDLVHGGDHFQANLATRWSAGCHGDVADLFRRLAESAPAPFMALMEFDGLAIASASPEQLFAVETVTTGATQDEPRRMKVGIQSEDASLRQGLPQGDLSPEPGQGVGHIRSRPIAGTRKRGADAAEDVRMERELVEDAKEQAEHTMLVDLVRNDVAQVAVAGSVWVPERGSIERWGKVMHLASRVEGRLRPGTSFVDWLRALFPGGTVTGAPKVRAMQRILESEPVERGPYTGSAGFLSWSHNARWSILIRTAVITEDARGMEGQRREWQGKIGERGEGERGEGERGEGVRGQREGKEGQPGHRRVHIHAGSGIVADSDPAREWHEARRKASALVEAAEGSEGQETVQQPALGIVQHPDLGTVLPQGSWTPPRAHARHTDARVLLIDNVDSFVHNLADHLAALGAHVMVLRNDLDWRRAVAAFDPTHVVLSPGPGWPDEAGCSLDVANAMHGQIPLLGVCLGHQAIAQAHGADVRVHPTGPVHGRADAVRHDDGGLFASLPSPLAAGRYHSLIVDRLGPDWIVDARLADGTVMAFRHRTHPTYGFQFHPESLCTPLGLELLDRFLATRAGSADGTAGMASIATPPTPR